MYCPKVFEYFLKSKTISKIFPFKQITIFSLHMEHFENEDLLMYLFLFSEILICFIEVKEYLLKNKVF